MVGCFVNFVLPMAIRHLRPTLTVDDVDGTFGSFALAWQSGTVGMVHVEAYFTNAVRTVQGREGVG
jgi:hypothetical protein